MFKLTSHQRNADKITLEFHFPQTEWQYLKKQMSTDAMRMWGKVTCIDCW